MVFKNDCEDKISHVYFPSYETELTALPVSLLTGLVHVAINKLPVQSRIFIYSARLLAERLGHDDINDCKSSSSELCFER